MNFKNPVVLIAIGLLVGLPLLFVGCGTGIYNGFVTKEQAVESQWGNVNTAYQRRADLIPNLVSTVKGAANFEQKTLTDVIEARSKASSIQIDPKNLDEEGLKRFQGAQDGISSALSRLLVVTENYPQLQAVQGFRDLTAQLEGTENRISVERRKFNEVAQDYNTAIKKFPGVIVANFTGFKEKPYFKADAGAENAPKVNFDEAPAKQ